MQAAGGVIPPAALPRRVGVGLIGVLLLAGACGDTTATTTTAPVDPTSTTTQSQAVATTSVPVTSEAMEPTTGLDIQGHRGARGLQPENTLPAFETALDLGVTTLELDLHFTADGQVVVWHDPFVHPDKCRFDADASISAPDIEQANEADLAIAGLNRDQLGAYQCDRNPDPGRFADQQAIGTALAGSDYRIVTLAELFDFVAAYAASDAKSPEQRAAAAEVHFNVETKRIADDPATINDGFDGASPGPFETAILEAVSSSGLADRVTIQSFDHRSLQAIRTVDSSISLAALTRRNEPFLPDFADFANIWSPDYRSLSADSLDEAQAAGVLVIPWTVNETTDMIRLIELGVDGIITDRPDLLIEALAAKP